MQQFFYNNSIIDITSGVNQWIFDNSPRLKVPQKNYTTQSVVKGRYSPIPNHPYTATFRSFAKRCLPIFDILIAYSWKIPNFRFPNVGMIDRVEFHPQTLNNQTPWFLLSPWFELPRHTNHFLGHTGRYHCIFLLSWHFSLEGITITNLMIIVLHGRYSTKGQIWAYLTGFIPRADSPTNLNHQSTLAWDSLKLVL